MSNKMMKLYTTNFETKVAKDDRVIEFIASKEVVDRDGEIVRIKGLDLKEYKKNPLVLLNHDRHSLPIGKATKVWKSGDELKIKIKFTEPEEYSVGDTVYKLVKGGYMNALSIGFLPDFDSIEYPEKRPGKKQVYRIFNKSALLEVSVVGVPANPEALITGKSLQDAYEHEIIDELEWNELVKELTNVQEKEETDDERVVGEEEKTITKEDDYEIEYYTEIKNYFDEMFVEFEANYPAKEQNGNPANDNSDDEVEDLIEYLRSE